MNIVGAILRGRDSDTYMVASCRERLYDVPKSVYCPVCGWKVDWRYIRTDYKLGRRRNDVSASYDGVTVVSQRVRSILEAHGVVGSIFLSLPQEPGFFAISPEDIAPFDYERRRTRREAFCDSCGLYGMVAGATPAFFTELPEGDAWIARSDVLFGSYNERHPLIVVSAIIADSLQKAGLSGIELEQIKAEQVVGADAEPAV